MRHGSSRSPAAASSTCDAADACSCSSLAARHRLLAPSGASAYSWPFKPFNKQHPIRGFFGDPRTVYENGILAGGFDGPGIFSFHQGIDISAPDGTPIYPVETGRRTTSARRR